MLSSDFRRIVAVALVLTTTFITMPLSAADFSSARPVIGSISVVGAVDLRGVAISQEGTLFSGDSIRAHEKGYAKVLLGTGSKIELSEKTDVSVNRDAQGVKIAMNTGTMGFTAKSPLRIDVMPYEVTATDDASGNVSVMSPTTAGVRAINGKVTVRNLKTSESFVLTKGQEQLLGLQNGVHAAPLATVASNNMPPIPAPTPAPQTPAGKTSGGLAMDTGGWLAVIGAGAITGIAIWALVEAKNNNDDINSLNNQIKNLNTTIGVNQRALQNVAATSQALSASQAALTQVIASATQALLALQAGGQGNTSQAANLQTTINNANAALGTISGAQSAAAACSANPSPTCASSVFSTEETIRANVNSIIAAFNANIAAAAAINSNVRATTISPVGAPPVSSVSVPV